MPDDNRSEDPAARLPWRRDDRGAARLIAAYDPRSGTYHFPPPPSRLAAYDGFEVRALSPVGTLYSYSVIHPHKRSSKPPFAVAYVDFPEGVRVFGRLKTADGKVPPIGSALEAVIETDAEGRPDYVFQPCARG